MRTIPILISDSCQTIHIPKDIEFSGINELEIMREGDTLILRPARSDWLSFANIEKADNDFLLERPNVVIDEGHCE